ncbi:hypothetical protein V501_01063 [Pseudogymnoascus sp. VKM F-4519 (FW-2642)]|nr:hypothetical protein V501_01063 [Pseudogymnoascus sp. VKM F-4519 (FW-2642)]
MEWVFICLSHTPALRGHVSRFAPNCHRSKLTTSGHGLLRNTLTKVLERGPVAQSSNYHRTIPQNLNIKHFVDAHYMSQEISRQGEQRNRDISPNNSAQADRNNNRRDKGEEAQSCDPSAEDCYEEMRESPEQESRDFNEKVMAKKKTSFFFKYGVICIRKTYFLDLNVLFPATVAYLALGFGLTVSSGNFLNKSAKLSIDAAIKPATVSNGGLLGAEGWLLVGTMALVRPKLLALLLVSSALNLLCRAGRSSMAISFGGITYPWSSGKIIGLFVCSGVLFIILGIQQVYTIFTTTSRRIVPVEFFKSRTLHILFAITSVGSTSIFLPINMVPIFFQFTRNDSALEAGVRLLPFIFLMVFAVIGNGIILSLYGYYMPWYTLGGILVVTGGALMYTIDVDTSASCVYGYFKPYKGYHDGGLGGDNNPVNLALWEQDLIWDRKGKQPDFVLSLGTGSTIETDSGDIHGSANTSWISQLFLPRLFSVPQEHRPRYHRFTLGFHGPEPKLDDVNCMQDLRGRVDTDASLLTAEVRRCVDNILASLFYLELDCLPLASGFNLQCKARILCRLDPGTRELLALLWQLKESQARFYVQSTEQLPCVDQISYTKIQHGEPFCTPVEFCISSMDDLVDVKVDGIAQRARSISNCPYKLLGLVKDQGLHRVFGGPDHKRRLPLLHHVAKRRKITPNKSSRQWHAVK